jgi:ketopantoate hydroxymethyltransferase
MGSAFEQYIGDVKRGDFPSNKEQY